jgi:hypothetical protein
MLFVGIYETKPVGIDSTQRVRPGTGVVTTTLAMLLYTLRGCLIAHPDFRKT